MDNDEEDTEDNQETHTTDTHNTAQRVSIAALFFATCALIILIAASLLMCYVLITNLPPSNTGPGQGDAVAYTLAFVWPGALITVAIFGSIALYIKERRDLMAWLTLSCMIVTLGLIAILTLIGSNPYVSDNLPVHGLPILIVVLYFLGVNVLALYCAKQWFLS